MPFSTRRGCAAPGSNTDTLQAQPSLSFSRRLAVVPGLCAWFLGACLFLCAGPLMPAASAKKPPAAPPPALIPATDSAAETAGPLEPETSPRLPSYETKDNFSFAVLGNSAPPGPGLPTPRLLFSIYNDLAVLRPDILFHTGDFSWVRPGDQADAQLELGRFRLVAKGLEGIPIYVAPGSKDIPDEEADVAFRKIISGGLPWRSFDFGSSHFIVLDTEVPNEAGKITGAELTWLQSDLAANTKARHTFVFLNRTPYPTREDAPGDTVFSSPADRDAFTGLMAASHVTTVFSGGQAVFSSSTHDGVNYINTGGAGGPTLYTPQESGYIHYVLVTVNGDDVSAIPVEPGRVDVIFSQLAPGLVTVYNTTPSPITLNHVTVPVDSNVRKKHAGLLGAAKLSVYQVSASVVGNTTTGTADAAAVDLEESKSLSPLDPDLLYVRVAVPANSAVNVKVQPVP